MKITLQQIDKGTEEVIIKYKQMTEDIDNIVRYIEGKGQKLIGMKDGQESRIHISEVIYLESVDGGTYLYTKQKKECFAAVNPWSLICIESKG